MFTELNKCKKGRFTLRQDDILRKASSRAPNEPGVYCIYQHNELLYVGGSFTGLRRRINNKREKMQEFLQSALDNGDVTFHWYVAVDRAQVRDLKKLLLVDYQLKHGKLPEWNRE